MIGSTEVSIYSEQVTLTVPIFSNIIDFVITSEYSGRLIFESDGVETEMKSIYLTIKKIDPGIVYPPYKYFKSFTSYRSDLSTVCNGNTVSTNIITIPLTYYIYLDENLSIKENRDNAITKIIS